MRDYSVVSQRGPEEGAKCHCIFHWEFFHCRLLNCPIKSSDRFPSPFKQITGLQETARIIHWIYSSNRTMLPASHYPLDFPLQEEILGKNHGRNINPWLLYSGMTSSGGQSGHSAPPSSALLSVQIFRVQRAQWLPKGYKENDMTGVRELTFH